MPLAFILYNINTLLYFWIGVLGSAEGNTDHAIMGAMTGFTVMMTLDAAFSEDLTEIFCGYFLKAGILSFMIQFTFTGDNPC